VPIQKTISTYAILTVVAILIWFWAAGETREQKTINYVRVQFTLPPDWLVKPGEQAVTVVIDGSKFSIQNAESVLRRPLKLSIPATVGKQMVDIMDRLRHFDELRATGVTFGSSEPAIVELDVDEVQRTTAQVKAMLPSVITEGEVRIIPPEVTLAIPSQIRQGLPSDLTVEAPVDRSNLDRMPPGIPQTLDVKLRLPEDLGLTSDVLMIPSKVKLTFTIRSRTRETKLDRVPVQLAAGPDDGQMHQVEIDPKELRDVTISADADLIRRIEAKEAPVIAVLHVSAQDMQAKIESKRISYFVALVPEPGGGVKGVQVTATKFGESTDIPQINLKVTGRTP